MQLALTADSSLLSPHSATVVPLLHQLPEDQGPWCTTLPCFSVCYLAVISSNNFKTRRYSCRRSSFSKAFFLNLNASNFTLPDTELLLCKIWHFKLLMNPSWRWNSGLCIEDVECRCIFRPVNPSTRMLHQPTDRTGIWRQYPLPTRFSKTRRGLECSKAFRRQWASAKKDSGPVCTSSKTSDLWFLFTFHATCQITMMFLKSLCPSQRSLTSPGKFPAFMRNFQ